MTSRTNELREATRRFAEDVAEIYRGDLNNSQVCLAILGAAQAELSLALSDHIDRNREADTDAQESRMGPPEAEAAEPAVTENWPWGVGSFWAELRKAGIPVKGRP